MKRSKFDENRDSTDSRVPVFIGLAGFFARADGGWAPLLKILKFVHRKKPLLRLFSCNHFLSSSTFFFETVGPKEKSYQKRNGRRGTCEGTSPLALPVMRFARTKRIWCAMYTQNKFVTVGAAIGRPPLLKILKFVPRKKPLLRLFSCYERLPFFTFFFETAGPKEKSYQKRKGRRGTCEGTSPLALPVMRFARKIFILREQRETNSPRGRPKTHP